LSKNGNGRLGQVEKVTKRVVSNKVKNRSSSRFARCAACPQRGYNHLSRSVSKGKRRICGGKVDERVNSKQKKNNVSQNSSCFMDSVRLR
jgi:hypothetical protein